MTNGATWAAPDGATAMYCPISGGWSGAGAARTPITERTDRWRSRKWTAPNSCPTRITASIAAAGYPHSADLSGETQEGYSTCEVTVDERGRRASTSRAYLKPALARKNLTVISHAQVNRILFDGQRAIGVAYRQDAVVRAAKARVEVILSAGAYNSPHLLMLSGIGPAENLKALGIAVVADNPAVGANLSEHPVVYAEFTAAPVTFLSQLRIDRAVFSVLRWALFGKGPFATQITSCTMLLKTVPELSRPDIQLVFLPVRLDAKIWIPGISKKLEHAFSVMIIQLHPQSRGRVRLRSADPAAAPQIALNLLSTERDYAELRRGIAAVRKIFSTAPLRKLVRHETKPGSQIQRDTDLDTYIRQNIRITQHPVGTCRMGVGEGAVVDPQLRVIGVEGLRVVDASVMPTVPGGNINAPVIMLAEKAADIILAAAAA